MKKTKKNLILEKYNDKIGKITPPKEGAKDQRWNVRLKNGKQFKAKSEDALKDALVKYLKENEETHSFCEACEQWLADKVRYKEIGAPSATKYQNTCARFFKGTALGEKSMKDITELELEDFLKSQIADNELIPSAWRDLKTVLIGTFKYAKKRGWTSISIKLFLEELEVSRNAFGKSEKLGRDSAQVFTDDEIDSINALIEEKPDAVNLGILFTEVSGVRISELSTLKRTDLEGNVLKIRRREVRFKGEDGHIHFEVKEDGGKGAKNRDEVLTDYAVGLFKELVKLNPFGEYLIEKDGKRVRSTTFTNRLTRKCDKLGIEKRTMHKLRKTYATDLFDAGVSEHIIINNLGHTTFETTKNHYIINKMSADDMAFELNEKLSHQMSHLSHIQNAVTPHKHWA